MKAIIIDRNKQYYIGIGNIIQVDLLKCEVGDILTCNKILLIFNDKLDVVGYPFVKNSMVLFQVIESTKGLKRHGLKFKRRKNYVRKYGYRVMYTLLKVLNIKIL